MKKKVREKVLCDHCGEPTNGHHTMCKACSRKYSGRRQTEYIPLIISDGHMARRLPPGYQDSPFSQADW